MSKRRRRQERPRSQLPAEVRLEQVEARLIHIQRQTFRTGPLPPAEELARYEQACPGAADRIVTMAEKQADHRRSLEVRNQVQGGRRETVGMVLGFIVAMTAILSGVYLIGSGAEAEGLASIITALGGLVAVFVYAKREKTKELGRKWERMLGGAPPPEIPSETETDSGQSSGYRAAE